eukprot:1161291-Pelagomonas_calceolata.AAC.4
MRQESAVVILFLHGLGMDARHKLLLCKRQESNAVTSPCLVLSWYSDGGAMRSGSSSLPALMSGQKWGSA